MSLSTRILAGTGAVVMAAGAMVFAEAGDATKVLADMRKALGGEAKLAAVKSLTAVGKSQRSAGETSTGGDYELVLEMPDKFFTRQILAETPFGKVGMKLGFNGDELIQETEQPQMPGGGGMQIRFNGSSGSASPEAKASDRARLIKTSKQDLARMALGMFGTSVAGVSLEFTSGGVAEGPEGKADVILVKGADEFAGKLFVDQKTHLPLMFSWMAKEPMQMTSSVGGGHGAPGGGAQTATFTSAGGGKAPTKEENDKMMADFDARMKAAEANRKMVEFRMFYSNYQSVDGLQLPHTFQQAIGSNPTNEVTIEKYKINPKIDPKKFETVK